MAGSEIYKIEIPIIVDDQTDAPLAKAREQVGKFERLAEKTNERIRQHFQKISKLQIEPVMRIKDRLTSDVLRADKLIRKLDVAQASPLLAAQDRVSAVVARADAMLDALDKGHVNVVADMKGPLLDEIVKAKASLSVLDDVKAGPVAELRGELFGQLTKAMSQIKTLDTSMAEPRATLRERVTWKIREIGSKLRGLTSRAWNVTVGVKDKVTGFLGKVGRMLMNPLTLLGGGAGIYGMGKITVGNAASTELQLTTMETLLRSQKRAEKYMSWAMKEAADTMFSDVEMMNTALSLTPYARTDIDLFKEYVKTAEILAAINPAEGLSGGAFALREALSGDFVSLQERFNLPRSVINSLKTGATTAEDYLQVVLKAAESMGYTYELVKRQGETAIGLWSTITGNVSAFARKTGEGILESMKPRLERITAWFDENQDTVERWKKVLVRFGREGAERVLAFFERAFTRIARLLDDPKFERATFTEKVRMLVEAAMDDVIGWLEGPGKEKLTGVFTTLGEAGAKAYVAGMKSLGERSLQELKEGDVKGAAIPATAMWLLGGGMLAKGAWGLGKGVYGAGKWTAGKLGLGVTGTTAAETATVAKAGTTVAGRTLPVLGRTLPWLGKVGETVKGVTSKLPALGKVGHFLGRAALPLAVLGETVSVARSQDKVKALLKGAGGIGGGIGGAKLGALAGTAILPGIGTIAGGALGGIGGYLAGRSLGGKTVDMARGATSHPATSGGGTREYLNQEVYEPFREYVNRAESWGRNLMKNFMRGRDSAGMSMGGWLNNKVYEPFREYVNRAESWGRNMMKNFVVGMQQVSVPAPQISALAIPRVHKHAMGGILTSPHLGLVAEAGPEVIIPLSARMRSKALSLYEETGRRLGIRPYAEGGFAGPGPVSVPVAAAGVSSLGTVAITTGPIGISFSISTSNGQDVLQAIRANYKTIANEITETIADGLKGAYHNMPK